jgi:hypothetical protein
LGQPSAVSERAKLEQKVRSQKVRQKVRKEKVRESQDTHVSPKEKPWVSAFFARFIIGFIALNE